MLIGKNFTSTFYRLYFASNEIKAHKHMTILVIGARCQAEGSS